jgi:hypothetical protein
MVALPNMSNIPRQGGTSMKALAKTEAAVRPVKPWPLKVLDASAFAATFARLTV